MIFQRDAIRHRTRRGRGHDVGHGMGLRVSESRRKRNFSPPLHVVMTKDKECREKVDDVSA